MDHQETQEVVSEPLEGSDFAYVQATDWEQAEKIAKLYGMELVGEVVDDELAVPQTKVDPSTGDLQAGGGGLQPASGNALIRVKPNPTTGEFELVQGSSGMVIGTFKDEQTANEVVNLLLKFAVPQTETDKAGFSPPQGVRAAAQRGLDLRREFGRGGTAVGISRARDLARGANIPLDTIGRMVSFFARHGAQNADKPPAAGEDPDNGYIAWLLWGGNPGKSWADSIWRREKDKVSKREFAILSKSEEEERTVFGIVLEPEVIDSQNDIYNEDEIRKTAYRFMERYQQFGLMHKDIVSSILPLESYLAPCDFEIEGQKVSKGTWLLRVRVLDDTVWKSVKSGELTGFSIGGSALRTPDTVKLS